MKKILCFSAAIAIIVLFSCNKETEVLPPVVIPGVYETQVAPYLSIGQDTLDYRVTLPTTYMEGLFPAAQSDARKAELGRVLFFDKHLSKDGKVSCGSCHQPKHAFADGTAKSKGIFDRITKRNSMALQNTIWMGGHLGIDSVGNVQLPLFWDSRSHSITAQSSEAFTNPDEMGMKMPEVLDAVRKQPYYQWLFERAWGDTAVYDHRIFTSLSHFIGALSAKNTIFDHAMIHAGGVAFMASDFLAFTSAENRGKALFLEHCESCHGSLNSVPHIFEANNGLESPYIDQGKGAISGLFYERGIFKVPGLRNISFSAPYMHDGRFGTLMEVVEHYNSGVKQVFGLHGDLLTFNPDTQTYSPKRLNLTAEDKQALVSFLKTLTDEASMTDPRFTDPFK